MWMDNTARRGERNARGARRSAEMKCPQCGEEKRYYAIPIGRTEFRWCKGCGYHANIALNDIGASTNLDFSPIKAALDRLKKTYKAFVFSADNVARLQRAIAYSAMRKVFDDFHVGLRTKGEVAMAIGLWQRSFNAPPPTVDRIKTYWERYSEYFHAKAVEACKAGAKKYRGWRWKYHLYMRLYRGK
jgi:hypothetical protein